MASYVGLFRGPTPDRAKLVGITHDAEVVARVVDILLSQQSAHDGHDPALGALERGRRQALLHMQQEVQPRPQEIPCAAE